MLRTQKNANARCCLIFLSFVVITTLLLYTILNETNSNTPRPEQVLCHFIKSEDSLPDVSDFIPSDTKRNIFFLETSCNSHKASKIVIKARQACAVESAARMNPNMSVNLLYASPGVIKDEDTESDRILEALISYPNINILHFDIERFIRGTPVEDLWISGRIQKSYFPMAHTSDILRLLTLWKFGGIYLDLDVIVVKSLELFPENFAGAESDDFIANGVMGFSKVGNGHEYVSAFMEEIKNNFNGRNWAYNGPSLITRTISRRCPQWTQYGECEEFTIFPKSSFYLIPWQNWKWFFEKYLKEIIEIGVQNKSFMIHTWNKLSHDRTIFKNDTGVPYLHFAKTFCPKVFLEIDEVF